MLLDNKLCLSKVVVLGNLYISKYDKIPGTIAEFEKLSGLTPGNPTSRKMFKNLINNTEILKINDKTFFGFTRYIVNKKELKKLLNEQEIYKVIMKCFYYDIPWR